MGSAERLGAPVLADVLGAVIIPAMETPANPHEPDAITKLRRGLPVGEAGLMPTHKLGPPVRTAWVLRRADSHIAQFRRNPDCKTEHRAVSWMFGLPTGVEVHLVAVAIGIGIPPYRPDDISAAFINEHEPVVQGMLENLTTQSIVPVQIIGDTPEFDCVAGTDNNLRAFAQRVLAKISAMPAWTSDDFKRAAIFFKQRFPTKMALWERFGPLRG